MEAPTTSGRCLDELTLIRGGDLESGSVFGTYCGQIRDSTVILNSGFEDTNIIFKTDDTITDRGFNLTYSYNDCGGVLTGPHHEIGSTGTDQDCVWLLNFQEGQQIVLSRFSLNMDNSPSVECGQRGASFVIVR